MCIHCSSYCSRCRFSFELKKSAAVRGTVYPRCVYIVLVTAVDADFPLNLKKVSRAVRGTMYTKCVYIVPVVYTSFLLLQ